MKLIFIVLVFAVLGCSKDEEARPVSEVGCYDFTIRDSIVRTISPIHTVYSFTQSKCDFTEAMAIEYNQSLNYDTVMVSASGTDTTFLYRTCTYVKL